MTIDGPAGSGKSTTAREVARRLGYRHLDSGSLYRALTFALLDRGIEPGRWSELRRGDLDAIPLRIEPTESGYRLFLGDRPLEQELRTAYVTDHVARVAELAEVRAWLMGVQRDAGRHGGLVADGRDMGSVVFPDAEFKFFLTAGLRERAGRRLRERGVSTASEADLEAEISRIAARDRTDSQRELSPLRRPAGAHQIDTTEMGFEDQVEAVVALVQRAS